MCLALRRGRAGQAQFALYRTAIASNGHKWNEDSEVVWVLVEALVVVVLGVDPVDDVIFLVGHGTQLGRY